MDGSASGGRPLHDAGSGTASEGAKRVGGTDRGLFRTFLWAPLDPASWRALLAIVLGFAIAILAFGTLSAFFSAGGSLLRTS